MWISTQLFPYGLTAIRWTLQPQASEVVRGSKLSDRLRGLAAKCWLTKANTPRVIVREKK